MAEEKVKSSLLDITEADDDTQKAYKVKSCSTASIARVLYIQASNYLTELLTI